jgi:hypothetical protein
MRVVRGRAQAVGLRHLKARVGEVETVCNRSSIVWSEEEEGVLVSAAASATLNCLLNAFRQYRLRIRGEEKQRHDPRLAYLTGLHTASAEADIVWDLRTAVVGCVPSLYQDQHRLVLKVVEAVAEVYNVSLFDGRRAASILLL